MKKLDIDRPKNIHLIGVGGCGMSAIAKILKEMGHKVSGSDVKEGPNTMRLKELGVKICIGHEASLVREADIVVYSSAVTKDNPEMMEAKGKGIRILKRAEMLAMIMDRSKERIAVAGTHGKTTTTAMLAKVLEAAKLNPTFMIGCDMDYVDGNAKLGNGKVMVTEADESDSSFLFYSPTVEIITNIEADHMEHFGDMEELLATFEKFVSRLAEDGFIVMEGNDPNNQKLMANNHHRYITYGLTGDLDYTAKDLTYDKYLSRYKLFNKNKELGDVELSVPGWQNILNSLAVFAVGFEMGIDFPLIKGALRSFVGARRRFSTVGEEKGVLIIDDYAHHPTEIKATLTAARSGWPGRRIICVFQPHRYTRTLLLKDKFGEAFDNADKTIIADVYAASEAPIPGISGQTISDLLDPQKASFVPKKEQIVDLLLDEIKEGDIIMTLGAGDIHTVGREILSRLKMRI
ncbi:MAG: UDP-N-acetylmuramate--L-alanine ligase [bacterium]